MISHKPRWPASSPVTKAVRAKRYQENLLTVRVIDWLALAALHTDTATQGDINRLVSMTCIAQELNPAMAHQCHQARTTPHYPAMLEILEQFDIDRLTATPDAVVQAMRRAQVLFNDLSTPKT